jgi:hypothetical protein
LLGLVPDKQRDAGLVSPVHRDIDGVLAGFLELQLLDIDHEIPHKEIELIGNDGIHWDVDAWHHEPSVLVHKVNLQLVGTFLDFAERDAQGYRTLRMHSWQLTCDDGIESAEDVQLSTVICGCIAKDRNLNIHDVVFCLLTRSLIVPKPGGACNSIQSGAAVAQTAESI